MTTSVNDAHLKLVPWPQPMKIEVSLPWGQKGFLTLSSKTLTCRYNAASIHPHLAISPKRTCFNPLQPVIEA
jgi:hypothetical protein